jgi:hypothetical protein
MRGRSAHLWHCPSCMVVVRSHHLLVQSCILLLGFSMKVDAKARRGESATVVSCRCTGERTRRCGVSRCVDVPSNRVLLCIGAVTVSTEYCTTLRPTALNDEWSDDTPIVLHGNGTATQ